MKRAILASALFVAFAVSSCTSSPPPLRPATTTTTTTTTTTVAPIAPPVSVPADSTPIMGTAKYSASQLTSWYRSKGATQASGSCATVAELAQLFISEGAAEGVRGDIAFIQAMLETGWLKHSERVPASFCNYSGIGAVDGGTGANQFPNATMGVRAQIHHLRAYADPKTTCSNFANPNASPRCHLVTPKGKAPVWEMMGNGNWATDPSYATKILSLYSQLRTYVGR